MFLRDTQANKNISLSQVCSNNGQAERIVFQGRYKGEKYKRIEANFSSYLLGKEFGGAHLIVISPAYILVNETGD